MGRRIITCYSGPIFYRCGATPPQRGRSWVGLIYACPTPVVSSGCRRPGGFTVLVFVGRRPRRDPESVRGECADCGENDGPLRRLPSRKDLPHRTRGSDCGFGPTPGRRDLRPRDPPATETRGGLGQGPPRPPRPPGPTPCLRRPGSRPRLFPALRHTRGPARRFGGRVCLGRGPAGTAVGVGADGRAGFASSYGRAGMPRLTLQHERVIHLVTSRNVSF